MDLPADRRDPSAARDAEDPDAWPRVKALLADCLDADPAKREALLAAAPPPIRDRVRSLLAADERAPPGLEDVAQTLVDEPAPDDDAPPSRLRRVGPYRLGRVLGEGGMGLVYEAFQEQPERTVALKILRPSAVSARSIQRFHAEIEILGRLQHPGIAPIFDAGVLEEEADGAELAVPWFAMERVDGVPLTTFAAGRPLGARLALFLDVCDAVQYAHQRGVIHRDLKPANLLVSRDDDAGDAHARVRVLDFGIARATAAGRRGRAGATLPGLALGTLPFMSPEQVDGDPREIDVRTDVYALGVVLYELLAGRLPLDVDDDPPTVAARRVREEEPPPPSAVDRTIDRDLDTIARRALEKDRERRYASVAELAADLRRFRRHEPIVARPPSVGYQLRKFARRHRGLVAGLALAAVLLVVAVTAIAIGFERTRIERDKARSVLSLLRGVLIAASPYRDGADVTAASLLDRAVRGLGPDHPPEVEATLRRAIGETYLQLGRIADGVEQLERAVALLRDAAGADALETLDAEVELAMVSDRGEPAALADERALADRCAASLGPVHRTTLRARVAAAGELAAAGRTAEAERRLVETEETMRRVLGRDHETTVEALEERAGLATGHDRLDEAVALRREVLERHRRRGGEEQAKTLVARGALALALDRQGRHAEAERHHRGLYDDSERLFGEESLQAFAAEEALAQNLVSQRRLDEAERLLVDGLERARRLGQLAQRQNSLAVLYGAQGRLDEAVEQARRSYESTRITQGDEAVQTMIAYENWASMRLSRGETEEALAMLETSVAWWREQYGPGHPDLIGPLNHLANAYAREQRWAEAEPLYREAADRARAHLHDTHLLRVTAISSLGICLASQGRFDEAEPLLLEGLEGWSRLSDHQAPRSLNVLRSLAMLYRRTGRPAEAEELDRRAEQLVERKPAR